MVQSVAIILILEHIDRALFRSSSIPRSSGVEESQQSNSNHEGKPTRDTTYDENILTGRTLPRIPVVGTRTSNSAGVAKKKANISGSVLLTRPTYEDCLLGPFNG